MPTLNIKDAEVRQLAQELATRTGQTMTEAVKTALREKLQRERNSDQAHKERILQQLIERARRVAAAPTLDNRSEHEILGYDENGIPG